MLRLQGVSGIEVLALPMGYSFALIVHSVVMLVCARKMIFVSLREVFVALLKSLVAALVGGYAAYVALNQFVRFWDTDTFMTILAQGFSAALCGGVVYVCVQYLFRNTELREIYGNVTVDWVVVRSWCHRTKTSSPSNGKARASSYIC